MMGGEISKLHFGNICECVYILPSGNTTPGNIQLKPTYIFAKTYARTVIPDPKQKWSKCPSVAEWDSDNMTKECSENTETTTVQKKPDKRELYLSTFI